MFKWFYKMHCKNKQYDTLIFLLPILLHICVNITACDISKGYEFRTFPVMHVIFGVNTSCAEGGSSRGGRPLRLCFGSGGSSASPSRKTVSTPGVAAPGLWPVLFRSFCVESLRQLTSARPLMCKSSAVLSNDDSLVYKTKRRSVITRFLIPLCYLLL